MYRYLQFNDLSKTILTLAVSHVGLAAVVIFYLKSAEIILLNCCNAITHWRMISLTFLDDTVALCISIYIFRVYGKRRVKLPLQNLKNIFLKLSFQCVASLQKPKLRKFIMIVSISLNWLDCVHPKNWFTKWRLRI